MSLFKRVQLVVILTVAVVACCFPGAATAASGFQGTIKATNNTSDTIWVRFSVDEKNKNRTLLYVKVLPKAGTPNPWVSTTSTMIHVNVSGPNGKTGSFTFGVSGASALRVGIYKGTNRYKLQRE